MPVAIDKAAWSKSSQNSSGGHYDERAAEYENIAYRCRNCFAGCVFNAEEQKEAYEVQKKFVWWLPTLCAQCHRELSNLRTEDREYQKKWQKSKAALEGDSEFLIRWLAVLRAIPTFGEPLNSSMEIMLSRCLESTQSD